MMIEPQRQLPSWYFESAVVMRAPLRLCPLKLLSVLDADYKLREATD